MNDRRHTSLISVRIAALVALVAGGCAESPFPSIPTPEMPFVHRVDVQQGNVVTQEMVAQLRLGMDKKKVRYVMGTPIIEDTFHSSRWDYIYTFHEGGGGTERRLVTAVFNEDGRLIAVEGDVKAALGKLVVDTHQDTSVKVPGEYKKPLLTRFKDAIPFTGDDEKTVAATTDADDEETGDDGKALPTPDSDEEADQPADASADESNDGDDGGLVAATDVDSVTVPEGAAPKKKKGFFKRIVDSIGIGADDDDDDDEKTFDPGDPKYRDPTDPDNN